MGEYDPYLPDTGYPLSPQQTTNAQTLGWIGAASNLANMSAPHFASQGPAPTILQLLTGGLTGYGSGIKSYYSDMAGASAAQLSQQKLAGMKQMQDILKNQYAASQPQGPVDPSANTQMTPTVTNVPTMAGAAQGSDGVPMPPVDNSALTPPGQGPSSYVVPPGASPVPPSPAQLPSTPQSVLASQYAPGAQPMVSPAVQTLLHNTAAMSGLPTEGLGPNLNKDEYVGQDGKIHFYPGSTLDPSYIGQAEGAKSGAQYPFQRQLERDKASVTPAQQELMGPDGLVTVPTNNLALATGGQAPGLSSYYQPSPAPVQVSGAATAPQAGPDPTMTVGPQGLVANVPPPASTGPMVASNQSPATTLASAYSPVVPLKEKTVATKGGENLAEAQKTLQLAAGGLPQVFDRFNQMSTYSKDASAGPLAAIDVKQITADALAPYSEGARKTSVANTKLAQLSDQGVLGELGPQLAQAGIRGNKFLESIAAGASGLKFGNSEAGRQAAIDGLRQQYIKNLVTVNNEVAQMGGKTVDLNRFGIFHGPQDPGWNSLPNNSVFYDATTGKQMVKH